MTFYWVNRVLDRSIGLAVWLLAKGLGDWVSILVRVILKIKKIVLEAFLLNTLHYKVWIKRKVEQSRDRSSALLYTSV